MLSVLFATEASSTIKENNYEEESINRGILPFSRRKLPFCWRKLRKAYFALTFYLPLQFTILLTQIEKNLFCDETRKSEL